MAKNYYNNLIINLLYRSLFHKQFNVNNGVYFNIKKEELTDLKLLNSTCS